MIHYQGAITQSGAMDNVRLIGVIEQYKKVGIGGLILLLAIPPTTVRHRNETVRELLIRDETFVLDLADKTASPTPTNDLLRRGEADAGSQA